MTFTNVGVWGSFGLKEYYVYSKLKCSYLKKSFFHKDVQREVIKDMSTLKSPNLSFVSSFLFNKENEQCTALFTCALSG